jgi:hypothetical protein
VTGDRACRLRRPPRARPARGTSASHRAPTTFKALNANLRQFQLHLGANIESPRDAARIRDPTPPLPSKLSHTKPGLPYESHRLQAFR